MLNMDFIKETLKAVYTKYANIRLGIIGSYANGTATTDSDLDILVDGDSMQVELMDYLKELFNISVDVLWVDLLEKEDQEIDQYAIDIGVMPNEFSIYKTALKEVIWI